MNKRRFDASSAVHGDPPLADGVRLLNAARGHAAIGCVIHIIPKRERVKKNVYKALDARFCLLHDNLRTLGTSSTERRGSPVRTSLRRRAAARAGQRGARGLVPRVP